MKKFFFTSVGYISPLLAYSLLRKRCDFLFFSGTKRGRYSFLPLDSFEKKEIKEGEENSFNVLQKKYKKIQKNYNLSSLDGWNIPFSGGLNALFSYDYTQFFEKGIWEEEKNSIEKKTLAYISFSDSFLVFDHEDEKCFIAGWFSDESSFSQFNEEIKKGLQKKEKKKKNIKILESFSSIISKEEYLSSFAISQKEIEDGRSFQINLSQGFSAFSSDDAFDIFCKATQKNPAPMMGFCEWDSVKRDDKKIKKSIISCSPERLFSLDSQNKIFTQPIAGTRPRGKSRSDDIFFEHQLKTSEKEISEHSMIVDLLRNDFGKISEFGSVRVVDFARIEKYETVMHLVSDIEGIISSSKNAFDVFQAMFPGGTITGTPKRETIKILKRIEKRERSFYCGSMGYISFSGESDFNILIRTLEYSCGELYGRAGGGIVFAANGENEYEESLNKWSGIEKIFKEGSYF